MNDSRFSIQELDIDLEGALMEKPLFARELIPKLERDEHYLDWWQRDSMNNDILQELAETTIKNDYNEYDNLDFITRSAWSKQKGVGKSSVAMALKLYYDNVLTDNGFNIEEYFFTVAEKIKFHREKAGLLERRFFVLDEQVPQIGQSSQANMVRMLRIDDATRIRGFCNNYVSPRGEELFSHDYYFDTVLKDVKHKTIICCVRARDRTALGWMGFPRPPKREWELYQVKKLQFTKELEEGQVVRMEFEWLYDKVAAAFNMEGKFQEELDYFTKFKAWNENRQGLKPMKPKVQVTPKRIRDWIVAVNPELTTQELASSGEFIYAMLEEKFKKNSGGE